MIRDKDGNEVSWPDVARQMKDALALDAEFVLDDESEEDE